MEDKKENLVVCIYPPKYTSEKDYLLGVIAFLIKELRKYKEVNVIENNEYKLCGYKAELENAEKNNGHQ